MGNLYKKSKELAPDGYEFYINISKDDYEYSRYINEYKAEGILVISKAYDIFDREMKSYVAIYKKKGE